VCFARCKIWLHSGDNVSGVESGLTSNEIAPKGKKISWNSLTFIGLYGSSGPSKSTISASLVLRCDRGWVNRPRFVARLVRDCVRVIRARVWLAGFGPELLHMDSVSVSCFSRSRPWWVT
jgi:hypothetical protein